MTKIPSIVAPDLADGPPPEPLSAEQIREHLAARSEIPHCFQMLGFSLIDFSIEERWIEAEFNPTQMMTNLRGSVQGGIITAMLDEVMSMSVLVSEQFTCGVPTLEMKTTFHNPLPLGTCRGRGEAVRIGGRVAFMEGTIWTPDGKIAARGSSTCQVRRVKPAKG